MKLAFVFNLGRQARLSLLASRKAPTDFFLGAIELQRSGVDVRLFEVDANRPTRGFIGAVGNQLATHGCLPTRLTGSALEAVRPLLGELNACDCVVATTSGLGFALSAWKRVGMFRAPLAVIHCGLMNHPYGWIKKHLTNLLLSGAETILYGEGEAAPLLSQFPSAAAHTHVCQFGVDTEFWSPADNPAGSFVLSIGNDGRRDFKTVLETARRMPLIPFKIITSRPMGETVPPNVELIQGRWHSALVSDVDLRGIYQQALCVLVLLHESFQPSGQSVTLQAWACGCPVILTRTAGMWSRKMLRDGENVLLVEPHQPDTVVATLQRLRRETDLRQRLSTASRATVCREASIGCFATAVARICENAISARSA